MESIVDLLVSYQGEIATGLGLVAARYLPAGWRVIFRKSGQFAEWWAEFVESVPAKKTSK